ncbi:MAG: hypothetical protein JWN70_3726 [Planctomycetaceae bacterium]|nr:hypothetical protein [Planctomycetaceae bacterium]
MRDHGTFSFRYTPRRVPLFGYLGGRRDSGHTGIFGFGRSPFTHRNQPGLTRNNPIQSEKRTIRFPIKSRENRRYPLSSWNNRNYGSVFPEVAGSNPVPATKEGPLTRYHLGLRAFCFTRTSGASVLDSGLGVDFLHLSVWQLATWHGCDFLSPFVETQCTLLLRWRYLSAKSQRTGPTGISRSATS